MLFTEPAFLFCFLPILIGLYFASFRAWRNALLLAASILFYAKGGGRFTYLLAASVVFNYSMAIWIHRLDRSRLARALLAFAVGANLLVLGIFKYATFFVETVNVVGTGLRLGPYTVPHLVLPIGISFFTFHAISYVVDVYRGDADAQKSPVEAALYLFLFPQLIAGPIIRYREIASQLARRVMTSEGFAAGACRFTIGLAKKVLIANTVAVAADAIFDMPVAQVTAAHAWIGAVCYTLQIYFDFSGYSDMAIGLGAMFGFRFPENFNYPYVAQSVQEFWRRWHMSLSRWFRDYVYVPLGGNRQSTERTYVNLVTVFFLCGLWHGANWTFVIWGLYHGVFLVVERLVPGLTRERVPAAARVIRHVYVLLTVMVGWVFFRADTLPHALGFLKAMAGWGVGAPSPLAPGWYLDAQTLLAIVLGLLGSTPTVARLARTVDGRPFTIARPALVALLLVVCSMFIAARSYNPFIYFRF
jgi:alginate O-acetyltransferase complex protein AlgI